MPTMQEVVLPDDFFTGNAFDTEAKLKLAVEDRLEIMEAVNRFEWSFDARRFDALAALLTDDVIIDHIPGYGYHEGKKTVMEFMRSVVASVGIRHQATNAVLYINADGEACVLSYLFVTQVVDEPSSAGLQAPHTLAHAVVTDVFRKEGMRWKIRKRTFEQMKLPASFMPDDAARRAVEGAASQRDVNRNSSPQPSQAQPEKSK